MKKQLQNTITHHFMPNEFVDNIFEITPEHIKELNKKAIITDLDNTLVGWDTPSATDEVKEWFHRMNENGIKITVVSNNNSERVKAFCDPHDIEFIARAQKPRRKSLKKALSQMEMNSDDTVLIGDQMMTDVLGGNRLGLYTILVVPVKNSDGMSTKINRMLERRVLKYFERNNLLNKGEDDNSNI